jgi:hypothetical protein
VISLGGWLALSGDEEPEPSVSPVEVTHDPSVPVTSSNPPTTASIGPVEPGAVKPPVVAFGEGPTDGLWPVSTEGRAEGLTIAPGTYRTGGAADTAETGRCSWERRSGLVKSRNSVRESVTIRLQAGDFFRSQGCQQWIRGK